ncbi:hypothetical protein Syun_026286 [Stephania yunnanensis]|uniref:3'-5' exonuclease domain-containing protein n=1 Tax=Stephania yunnanensis TaxID=152371 RepID=A0AAP0HWJ9_9MAGN
MADAEADDGKSLNRDPLLLMVPIHIVTSASQLPSEFLEPSPGKQLIIGFDCEGIAFPDAIYLVDVVQGGDAIMTACKPALESNNVVKVIHDCKRDSEALYFQFGIKLHNVVDTQAFGTWSVELERNRGKRTRDQV